jgi:hypothetical protein
MWPRFLCLGEGEASNGRNYGTTPLIIGKLLIAKFFGYYSPGHWGIGNAKPQRCKAAF